MIDTAVSAIANPMRAFLTNAFGISRRTGEPGYSSNAVKTHADIMKIPSSAPSIKYSGQCCASAWPALRASGSAFSGMGGDALRPRCVAGAGEMYVSVTRNRIRIGAISDRDQRRDLQQVAVSLIENSRNSCDLLRAATSDRHSKVVFSWGTSKLFRSLKSA